MNKSELESELKKLASKIKEITPATKIYLFGSYAYGTPNEDSDIDLCILTDENRRKSIIFAFVLHCVLHFILHRHKEWPLFPLHVRRLVPSSPSGHAHRWMRW